MSAAQGGVAPAQRLPPTQEELADAENGIYHATPQDIIVCVGDLEGNSLKKLINPDGATPQSNTGVLTATASNLTELYAYLTVDPRGNLILQENVILVYLGDVIGDGPHNIELVTLLLKLKEDNPTRVIIITGNRDINKFRLGWELEPTDECMAELTRYVNDFVSERNSVAFNGFEFAFERNTETDFDYMFSDHPNLIASKTSCLERVIYVLNDSMGEKCGWQFLVDEYLTKHGREPHELTADLIPDVVKSYIYVYLVQAMSGAIACRVPEFNNIFEKLLMAGHLMACIETPDRGKFGLMHSLPPRMLIPTEPGRIYKEQFDKNAKDEANISDAAKIIDEMITSSNKVELNVGLAEFNSYVKNLYEYAKNKADPSKKRLLLEFVSGITSGSFDIYTGENSFSGLNLPVSYQTFNKAGFELLAKTAKIQTGGKMDDLKLVPAVNHIDMKDFSRIICSHKPQGYIGAKVKFGKQLYYCVDVSKIDEQDYDTKTRYGCCFLVIDLSKEFKLSTTPEDSKYDDVFIGRIMMNQNQFPAGHNVFVNDKDGAIHTTAFGAAKSALYANYVKTDDMFPLEVSSFIPKPPPGNFPHSINLTYLDKSYEFTFKNGPTYTKEPTLTLKEPAPGRGGSRTRKRRSKYPKKSTRTTHKRRRISKKLNRNKKNKKSKYGARR
jgi:hypothetical protein